MGIDAIVVCAKRSEEGLLMTLTFQRLPLYKHQRYKLWPEPLIESLLPAITMTSPQQDQFSDDAQHGATVYPSKDAFPLLKLPGGKMSQTDD